MSKKVVDQRMRYVKTAAKVRVAPRSMVIRGFKLEVTTPFRRRYCKVNSSRVFKPICWLSRCRDTSISTTCKISASYSGTYGTIMK